MTPPHQRPWVIAGCGYTGGRLARRLVASGADVLALRRDPRGLPPGIPARAVDLAAPGALDGLIPRGAVVVFAAPPTDGVAEVAVAVAAAAAGAARLVYLSSTGVYPPGDGGWIDEEVPPAPLTAQGAARLAAERAALGAAEANGLEAISLRVAGIYGPGRGVHARLRAGTWRPPGDPDAIASRVHVDDLVSAILAAGLVSPLPHRVCNVADDEPTSTGALAVAVAAMLGLPAPAGAPSTEGGGVAWGANRRIDNRRLERDLGVVLRYPTWREGVAQAIAEEDAAR